MRRSPGVEKEPMYPLPSGEDEQHLAISTVGHQASQVAYVLSMFVAITVLARRLSLSEFGTYALLVSLAGYVVFIQQSVEGAAIKAIAEAPSQQERDVAFSTAIALYLIAGAVTGAVIAVGGPLLLPLFGIPPGLQHQAQISVFVLAAVTCVGWPLRAFQDLLRGTQEFVLAAVADSVAYVVVAALLVALVLGGGSLWLLVGVGVSVPLLAGTASATIFQLRGRPARLRSEGFSVKPMRRFLGLSGYLFLMGLSGLVIYSLDRAILASFRSTAAVGLYEGPVRTHNLVRQVSDSLAITVLPTTARYRTEGDAKRTRELLLRGTRYTLAAVVPLGVVFVVLARPILEVWLGPRFGAAAVAMMILVGYWLLNANTGVAGSMLVAAGRARQVTGYLAGVAVLNLVLSLVLTPSLGLNGVVLGTAVAYIVFLPLFLALTLSTFGVRLAELAREAWVPAYLTGAVLAGILLAIRATVPLDTAESVFVVASLAIVGYWGAYYLIWLRDNERLLVRNIGTALLRRA